MPLNPISTSIINWYIVNKRNLPWRDTNDAYLIWLSEVILQQTRVEQGLPYFLKFSSNYPTVKKLALAPLDNVLKLWQGLGYYSRARNLHATANMVVNNFDGIFPTNYDDLITLKGIGTYTAAAISSFSINQPNAVLDGNVYRVLSRLFDIDLSIDTGIAKKEFLLIANELMPKNNAATFNQAIMEFGALQCKPVKPLCYACPVMLSCLSFKNKTIELRPVKKSKTKVRNRFFYYLHIEDLNNNIYINKRNNENDIWQGLYEFPLIEVIDFINEDKDVLNTIKLALSFNFFKLESISKEYKHILTHQHIYAKFIYLKLEKPFENKFLKVKNINNYAVPRLIDKYIQDIKLF